MRIRVLILGILFFHINLAYCLDLEYVNAKYKQFSINQDLYSSNSIGMIKKLKNGDVCFSTVDSRMAVSLYILNNELTEYKQVTTKLNFTDYRFSSNDNNIIFLDDMTNKLVFFNPYTGEYIKGRKPRKMFYPYFDDNDKRKEKYLYRLSTEKDIYIHKYKRDGSFQYAKFEIPNINKSKIIDITNGNTSDEVYILTKEQEKYVLSAQSIKKKNNYRTLLSVPDVIIENIYEVSLSPNKRTALVIGKNEFNTVIGLLDLNSDKVKVLKLDIASDIIIADWNLDSSSAIFIDDSRTRIYEIDLS